MAKKSLGQHFLNNKGKIMKIVDALELSPGQPVIEVGPGHGELTRYLMETGAQVIALEKDTDLISPLREKFPTLEVVEGDALATLPLVAARLKEEGKSYVIAGNIPYYITGYLLRTIGELSYGPTRTVLLIQKEVAERIAATDGKMSLLAASVWRWAEPRIVTGVPRSYFSPPPAVDSAVIALASRAGGRDGDEDARYYEFIHAAFRQPRKTLINNLAQGGYDRDAAAEAIAGIGKEARVRPEDISYGQLSTLFYCLENS
jgi:16S rRNA (adenine1518-N6/adenine1519-N6)-dimethyltransferase